MSGSRSDTNPPRGARAALDALLAGAAGDPVRRALWLDALDQRLRPLLPPPLAAHARLANVDGNRLVFLVDSPAWHARLRMATTALLDAARSVGLEVTTLAVRTTRQPLHPPPQQAPRPVAPMSAASRAALDAALASLRGPQDGERDGDGRDGDGGPGAGRQRSAHATGRGITKR